MTNVFHQGQATEAQKYAKEKYGAEVFIFDGKSDSATMTANVDQIMAQGIDAATLHIWDYETVAPAVQEMLGKGIILTSFFSPLGDSGMPVARSDEKGVSFAMGAEMAKEWKAANPDKPIVMVQLGWPNHTEVKSGRTDPFVQGVLSVDPTAKDLGCQDASKGADAAKQIIKDLVTQHPEVNLIYSEASNLTVGTMAGLLEAGRGKMDNGKPLTEIVASVDFDESEYKQVYDPNSSLKFSMGLPPIETGQGRIDLIMDVASGKIPMTSQPASEQFYKAYDVNYYTMPQADAAAWLNKQFGTNIAAPAASAASDYKPATDKPKKIAFFVSDMTNVFHQGQATEAQKYAKEKYGAEVFIFDGKSDSATMTANVDQIMAQGIDAATLHIWDYETVAPAVQEMLGKGIILTSFFSPLGDSGMPVARSDETGVSFAMGAEMAKEWKAANPDKPIVMVQLGWPNHTEVKSGRTDPFVQGRAVGRSDGQGPGLPGRQQGRGCGEADHQGPGDAASGSQPDLLRGVEPDGRDDGRVAGSGPRQDGQRQAADRDRGERGLRRERVQAGLRSQQFPQVLDGSASDRDRPGPHRPDHGCGVRQDPHDLAAGQRAVLQGLRRQLLHHAAG